MKFKIFLFMILAVLTVSCSDDMMPDTHVKSKPDGSLIEIVTNSTFPELSFASTRSMGDEPTIDDLRHNLRVNVFVFDPSGVMLQFIGPEDISILNIDEESKRVYFKVSNIYSSSMPRRLHFVVTSAPDLHDIQGGEYITGMASETTTMPALVVENGVDAYWGYSEPEVIEENMQLNVKMIRNFVKLSVVADSRINSNDFEILGYTIVNRPGKGTIAPYIYRDHLFATFLNEDNSLLGYDEIISQGYYGVNPSGIDAAMTFTTEEEVTAGLEESERLLSNGVDSPCYIYERSQSSLVSAGTDLKYTYAIVKGRYRGNVYYYKIDIGKDTEGKFGFYDLLRNFKYTINITEVGGVGALTVREAMNGAAHNNLSTSVVTKDLFSIGYKNDMIEVSTTRAIITEKSDEYVLRFRYTSNETFNPSLLRVYDIDHEEIEYSMDGAYSPSGKQIDLPGEVIESAYLRYDENDEWYELVVATKDIPSDNRRLEQNIRVYYKGGSGGLGRTVTLMLRKPWEFSAVTATTPGTGLKSEFSVSFNIPSGLAKTIFPLILTFESDKQNIYSKNGTQLTVSTGTTGFAGGVGDNIIYYEWRLEWEDYSRNGTEGGEYTATFRLNTEAADDRNYVTSSLDRSYNSGRESNNGTNKFCMRIANKGLKYMEPVFVNITRQ